MSARGFLFYHPPCWHASICFPSNSFVSPTCGFSSRNSFVSATYAKTGGATLEKCRRADIFSLLSRALHFSALLLFNHLRTLSFSVSHLSRVLPAGCALFGQKPGVHPLVIPIIRPSLPPKPQIRHSLRSALCVLCVSAVSLLFIRFAPPACSPCPSQHFPLKWGYPFPVITGENQ